MTAAGARRAAFGWLQEATITDLGKANRGLCFERIGTRYLEGLSKSRTFSQKYISDSLGLSSTTGTGIVGETAQLGAFAKRQRTLVRMVGDLDCREVKLESYSRFVTGMGIGNPVENGLTFHRTLGVPYLPGSGAKGVARSWARDWLPVDKSIIDRIFGPEQVVGGNRKEAGEAKRENWSDTQAGVGSVSFLDMVPVEPVKLKLEVMTPHGPGEGLPEDWGAPKPIFFVSVQEARFLLGAIPSQAYLNAGVKTEADRSERELQAQEDCRTALGWLVEALAEIGAGAKTKTGYGRMVLAEGP